MRFPLTQRLRSSRRDGQRGHPRHRSRSTRTARCPPAPDALQRRRVAGHPARRRDARSAGRSPRSTSTAASAPSPTAELDAGGAPVRRGPDRLGRAPRGTADPVHGRHPRTAHGVPGRAADRRRPGAGEHHAQAQGHRRAGRATAAPASSRSARSSPSWRRPWAACRDLADVVVLHRRRRCRAARGRGHPRPRLGLVRGRRRGLPGADRARPTRRSPTPPPSGSTRPARPARPRARCTGTGRCATPPRPTPGTCWPSARTTSPSRWPSSSSPTGWATP